MEDAEWLLQLTSELDVLYRQLKKSDQAAIWRDKNANTAQKTLDDYAHLRGQNPDDPGLAISHALLLSRVGRLKEAEAGYRVAIRLRPDHSRAHHLLAECLEKLGQNAEAETEYRDAIRLAGDNSYNSNLRHQGLGLVYNQGLWKPKPSFEKRVACAPTTPGTTTGLGMSSRNNDDGRKQRLRIVSQLT
jgi:tetratricopeptide (TPR) repeat protein